MAPASVAAPQDMHLFMNLSNTDLAGVRHKQLLPGFREYVWIVFTLRVSSQLFEMQLRVCAGNHPRGTRLDYWQS